MNKKTRLFGFCFFKDWVTVPNDDPCCQECKNKLILVVQLYCPLQGSIYHRTLYLFKCLTCKDGRFVWTKHPIGWLGSVYYLKEFCRFLLEKSTLILSCIMCKHICIFQNPALVHFLAESMQQSINIKSCNNKRSISWPIETKFINLSTSYIIVCQNFKKMCPWMI